MMAQYRTGRTATSYDWADIEVDHPIDLAARQRIMAERMMISRFVLEAGFHVAPHSHHNEQISIVLEGKIRYAIGTVGGDEFREETLEAGQTMSIPPFVPHGATALERTVVLDLFSPRSEKTGVDQG
jgi:quercetin dioxygenase-like cupin family protein